MFPALCQCSLKLCRVPLRPVTNCFSFTIQKQKKNQAHKNQLLKGNQAQNLSFFFFFCSPPSPNLNCCFMCLTPAGLWPWTLYWSQRPTSSALSPCAASWWVCPRARRSCANSTRTTCSTSARALRPASESASTSSDTVAGTAAQWTTPPCLGESCKLVRNRRESHNDQGGKLKKGKAKISDKNLAFQTTIRKSKTQLQVPHLEPLPTVRD